MTSECRREDHKGFVRSVMARRVGIGNMEKVRAGETTSTLLPNRLPTIKGQSHVSSSSSARPTSDLPRRRRMTSKSGCRRRTRFERFRRALTSRAFRHAGCRLAFATRTAKTNSCIRSMARVSPSEEHWWQCRKIFSMRMARSRSRRSRDHTWAASKPFVVHAEPARRIKKGGRCGPPVSMKRATACAVRRRRSPRSSRRGACSSASDTPARESYR